MKYCGSIAPQKGYNCFQSAFLNLLRCHDIDIEDSSFQFHDAGVKIIKKVYQDNMIHGNFNDSVYQFCEKNQIRFVEEEVIGDRFYFKNKAYKIIQECGPFIIFLSTKLFKYDKCFENENSMRHCVLVNEVNEKGVRIVDSYAAASEVNTFEGLLPYDDMIDLHTDGNINICKIENRDQLNIDLKLYRDAEYNRKRVEQYFMENAELDKYSRCLNGVEYSRYLKDKSLQIISEELNNIALNILVDSHVPQLRLVVHAMQLLNMDKDEFETLIKKWTLISFKFFKLSMSQNKSKYDTLTVDYEKLLLMEVELYRKIVRGRT